MKSRPLSYSQTHQIHVCNFPIWCCGPEFNTQKMVPWQCAFEFNFQGRLVAMTLGLIVLVFGVIVTYGMQRLRYGTTFKAMQTIMRCISKHDVCGS